MCQINIITSIHINSYHCRFISMLYKLMQAGLVISSLLFLSHVELEQEPAQLQMLYIIAAGAPLRNS